MSRKGNVPIAIPKGVEVKIVDGIVTVKGPKGQLHQKVDDTVDITIDAEHVNVAIAKNGRGHSRWQGLYHSLINNMIIGTLTGFKKQLELIGVGYRANIKGKALDLQLGFSHPTEVEIPEGIQIKVEKSLILIEGINKQQVGQLAATIRSIRPPEPYQGKGIRYVGEFVRKKAGKSAAKK
ncbi:MAG: 50S ribosomal protein L6 [Chlamydiales bacterium]|nr:50S ribosomal protein L6 [Chlamydiales bacterium]